jgi:tetratricopeptide (TPR) repeat protein
MEANKVTTSQVDASLGVNACQAFAAGDYKKAQTYLLEILDYEPNNWLARFYLATCYAKTNQLYAAQRAFRHIFDNTNDAEIRSKACLMLQRVSGEIMEAGSNKPSEFGRFLEAPGLLPNF